MDRKELPSRRECTTFDLQHGTHRTTFQVTIGYYPDGSIGEVFVSGAKAGSDIDSTARDGAILLSLALQHGAPLDVIRHAVTREADGKPSSIIGAVIERL